MLVSTAPDGLSGHVLHHEREASFGTRNIGRFPQGHRLSLMLMVSCGRPGHEPHHVGNSSSSKPKRGIFPQGHLRLMTSPVSVGLSGHILHHRGLSPGHPMLGARFPQEHTVVDRIAFSGLQCLHQRLVASRGMRYRAMFPHSHSVREVFMCLTDVHSLKCILC